LEGALLENPDAVVLLEQHFDETKTLLEWMKMTSSLSLEKMSVGVSQHGDRHEGCTH